MSKLRIIILTSIVTIITAVILVLLLTSDEVDLQPVTREQSDAAYALLRNSLTNGRYTYTDFLTDNRPAAKNKIEITASGDAVLGEYENITYNVQVPEDGLYYFSLEYNSLVNSFTDITAAVRVNGEIQYNEANTVILPVFWEDESKIYPVDKYGDETPPMQKQIPGPHTVYLFDTSYTTDTPLVFLFQQGENAIEISNETSQPVWLGNLTAYSWREAEPYRQPAENTIPELISINAISYVQKNSAHVSVESSSSPHIKPYSPVNLKINTVICRRSGDEVFYRVSVPQSGYYAVTFHYQTGTEDFASFISVKVNGEFPFAEAASYAMSPTGMNRWSNHTLNNEGIPYLFYLPRGNNIISVKNELSPVARQIRGLRLLIDHINQFTIEIRKITGNRVDRNRTWRITEYIPETKEFLDAYDIIFRDIINELSQYSPKGVNSSVISPMVQAVSYLELLRKKYEELPLYMNSLSGQDASVLQQAGVAMDTLYDSIIRLDAIYLGRTDNLPDENAHFITVFADGVRKLWNSYTSDKYKIRNKEDALNVWYASSYMQVDLLQKLIDTRYTPKTGVKVNLSVMPDMNKLTMARAARTNPDIAMGLPSYIPSELALRNALYDYTRFDDFWRIMGDIVPGALTSYILNEKVYAVPETITFAATVYREDILKQLNITSPDTWDDVTEMMAELQRFDMSFYMPIAAPTGYKWFYQTSPLIYQNNGLLYRPDGLGTAINEANAVKGITFLGDLFTTYALAEQVPNFFNSFRLGQTPVGIIDADTYILLTFGAPELMGQWSLSPFPGTVQEDGSISRWFIANGLGSIIFENTERPDECWEFLKWYLSEETQTDFAFSLFANYRIFYMPANINALKNIPINDKDKQVILDSVPWLRDAPRNPGQYLLERGISDIWNTIVFDGTPVRVAIDRQVIEIQREFKKKMTEFGYLDAQGNQIKPYVIREIDWIIEQIEKAKPGAGIK